MSDRSFIEEIVNTETDIAVAYFNGLVARAQADDKVKKAARLAFALSVLKQFVGKLERNKPIKEISEKIMDNIVGKVFEEVDEK